MARLGGRLGLSNSGREREKRALARSGTGERKEAINRAMSCALARTASLGRAPAKDEACESRPTSLFVASSGNAVSAMCTMDRRHSVHRQSKLKLQPVESPIDSPDPTPMSRAAERERLERRLASLEKRLADLELREKGLGAAEQQLLQRTAGVLEIRKLVRSEDGRGSAVNSHLVSSHA